MSNIDRTISNELVIPTVLHSEIFAGHEDARFAVGMLAAGDQVRPGLDAEFTAYLRLRANVYAYQTRMISPDQVRDGIEVDIDDSRSAHFGIFENAAGLGAVRSVATMRVIMKSEAHSAKLPIEDFFPEAFAQGATPLSAIEISRYICRHESAGTQRALTGPLFSTAVSYITRNALGPTYATVEPTVESDLKAKGVPMTRIADPIFVREYNAHNLGVQIDVPLMANGIEHRSPGMLAVMQQTEQGFVYFGQQKEAALGRTVQGAVA